MPIWGDVEPAWRPTPRVRYGPLRRWLVVTGTNGKTTTTSMLYYDMPVVAGGRRAALMGNIGEPCSTCCPPVGRAGGGEVSSFQLFWAPSLRPEAGGRCSTSPRTTWTGTADSRPTPQPRRERWEGWVAVVGDDLGGGGTADRPRRRSKVGFGWGSRRPGNSACATGLVDRAFSDDLVLAEAAGIPVAGPVGALDALRAATRWRAPSTCRPMPSPPR